VLAGYLASSLIKTIMITVENKKPFITFKQLEFWLATAVYVVSVYILAYNQFLHFRHAFRYAPNLHYFDERHLRFSYSAYYIIPQFVINTTYYSAFLFMNFIIDRFIKNWNQLKTIIITIVLSFVVYALVATALSTANTWMDSYLLSDHTTDELYSMVFDREFVFTIMLMVIYGAYAVGKYVLQYMLTAFFSSNPKPHPNQVNRECLTVFAIWAIWFMFFGHKVLLFANIGSQVLLLGLLIYWYSFNLLIPQILAKKENSRIYYTKISYLLLASIVPVTLISGATMHGFNSALAANFFTIGINLFFTAPFTWILYQYRFEKQQELFGLKTALGQSTADLDLLRSQINPHFLFNALNTLYGTALQENADRTGEGIQKLGDMMRFMLQENVQDKISLNREVEYLNNYISLQKLRTQTSPDIVIQVDVEDDLYTYDIAPMLLIPFVENAFKHGISLREPSHIKIALHVKDNVLFFDVYNSIHERPDNDPEKDKSGIGLENVKQRLQLLYPKKHELTIRQNAKEFFIHLSINL
jgi:hypothetical protein